MNSLDFFGNALCKKGLFIKAYNTLPERSCGYVESLIELGYIDKSVDLIKKYNIKKKRILDKLAFYKPNFVFQIAATKHLFLKEYCQYQLNNFDYDYKNIEFKIMSAIIKNESTTFNNLTEEYFSKFGLSNYFYTDIKKGFSVNNIRIKATQKSCCQPQKISVIMTCFNEEGAIEKAISSLLEQSYSNIEIIVIDDCSTDKTKEKVLKLRQGDSRISYTKNTTNIGIWKSKNVGLTKATGEYITFHDGNDISHKDKLLIQFTSMKDKASISSSYLIRANNGGLFVSKKGDGFLRWNPSSVLVSKGVINGEYFIDNLLGSDIEFIERIERKIGKTNHVKVKKPLSIASFDEKSLSNQHRPLNGKFIRRIKDWENWKEGKVTINSEN